MRISRVIRLKIIILLLLCFICVLLYKNNMIVDYSEDEIILKQLNRQAFESTPDGCFCTEPNGTVHNFCYSNPHNSTIQGKRFGCQHVEIMKELDLLNPNYIDLTRDEMPDPQFVTAISGNHILEGRRQLNNLHSLWPTKKILVYDLGLGSYREEYENNALVDLRDFPFKKYPKHVANLEEYRWKPIIIAETLKEFGAVFYMDSSIIFKDADLSPIYNQLRCRKSNTVPANIMSHPKYVKKAIANRMIKTCNKSSYLFHSPAGHSIFAATQPATYDFLPIDMGAAKSVQMYEAGMVTVVRTREAVDQILKWLVLCALEEKCMAPEGSKIQCDYKDKDRMTKFGWCHRFDQSAVNILAANLFKADSSLYTTGMKEYFSVDRDRRNFVAKFFALYGFI